MRREGKKGRWKEGGKGRGERSYYLDHFVHNRLRFKLGNGCLIFPNLIFFIWTMRNDQILDNRVGTCFEVVPMNVSPRSWYGIEPQ